MEENKTLENKVFEALGEVSMCWSETPKGVFESTRAKEIGDRLMKDIAKEWGNSILMDIKMIPDNFNAEELLNSYKNTGIQIVQSKPSLKEAIEVLCNALREDKSEGSYYGSWKDNISIAFQDEFSRQEGFGDISRTSCKNIADQAAKNFLNLLISK